MTTVADVIRHVEDKAEIVLRGELATRLATYDLPGVSDRLDRLDIMVGIGSDGLPLQWQGDLPRVECYLEGGESDNEALEQTTTRWRMIVAAVTQYDGGDRAYSAKAAGRLAALAAELLEQYLPDPTAASTTPIWDVRLTSPSAFATLTLDEERGHTMRAAAALDVFTRADLSFSPTYANATITPTGRTRLVPSTAAFAVADATDLGDVTPNRDTTITVASATLAGATYAGVDVSGVTTWPAGSVWRVFLGRHNVTLSGTTGASNPRATLATYSVADGDRWVVTVEHADTKQLLVWFITWDVT